MKRVERDKARCANCGLEIAWEPVVVDGKAYCCGGCAQGGPCYCSYDPPEISSAAKPPRRAVGAAFASARRSDHTVVKTGKSLAQEPLPSESSQ